MSPDVTPAIASSSVPAVDSLCRSMLRARSKHRSIGALIIVVNSILAIVFIRLIQEANRLRRKPVIVNGFKDPESSFVFRGQEECIFKTTTVYKLYGPLFPLDRSHAYGVIQYRIGSVNCTNQMLKLRVLRNRESIEAIPN